MLQSLRLQISSPKGFTIVELLIVVVVIAVLASITVVAYNGITDRSSYSQRLENVRNIQKAIELYKVDKGVYPNSANCINNPNEFSYQNRWCGYNQGVDDGFVPGIAGVYTSTVKNLDKSLPDNDTFLYQSRAANGEDEGTAQYQIIRLRVQGLNPAENTPGQYLITGNGYDGLAWGVKSNPSTPWW